jgi:hypothetical protein
MNNSINEAIWNQFGASIEMLENVILLCPEELWDTELKFWSKAYHCIFWTDYYLSNDPKEFTPKEPFDLSEFDPMGKMPQRTYSKQELITYLLYCKEKAKQQITEFNTETLTKRWVNDYKNYSFLEIIIYNIRHIQHHSAQLNLLLRQQINSSTPWISQTLKQ